MGTIRLAASLLLATTFILGCRERHAQPTLPGKPTGTFLADAAGKTSVVHDPVGDATKEAQGYQDIVQAEVRKQGGNFVFVEGLAAPVPDNPPVPAGSDFILWEFALDIDPNASPLGYPFPKDAQPFEFVVEHRVYRPGFTDPLDPTKSAGILLDRRPLLVGGQATFTPIELSIEGSKITWVVDAALLGDPSTFQWVAGTNSWSANNEILKNGYVNKNFFDLAPEVFSGAPWATWPQ